MALDAHEEGTKKHGTKNGKDVRSTIAGLQMDSCHPFLAPEFPISPEEFGHLVPSVFRVFFFICVNLCKSADTSSSGHAHTLAKRFSPKLPVESQPHRHHSAPSTYPP